MTLDEQFFHEQILRAPPPDEQDLAGQRTRQVELTIGERKLMDLFRTHPGRVLSIETVRAHLRAIATMPDVIAQSLVTKGLLRAVGEGRVADAYRAV
jgi:hypothetical protein